MSRKFSTSRVCPRCLLDCHALVFKSSVEVMPEGVRELGISDFDFLKFFEGYWGRVIESAFRFQDPNPNLSAFAIYPRLAVNLKAMAPQLELLESLKKVCRRKRPQYRMLKMRPMVVGLNTSSPTLELVILKKMLLGTMPPIVFYDDPIARIHDSLSMLLFRFKMISSRVLT
jgi:hypothetical protein